MRLSSLAALIATLVLAALLARPAPSPAQAQGEALLPVQVEGLAAIEGDNVTAARERAVADALHRAVERAAATLLPPETLAQQDALLREQVYADPVRFVQTYRIIAELPSGTLYQASIEAVVAREPLRQALVKLGVLQAGAPAGPLGIVSVTARGATRQVQLDTLTAALADRGQAQRVRYRTAAPGAVVLEVETPLAPAALAQELARLQVEGAQVTIASPDGRQLEVLFTPVR
jgi:hypothetical protein